MEKGTRNRSLTMQKIVDALEVVIAEHGMDGIGINRIAEKADVSKVLIYRYFGNVEGLLTYYIRIGKLFPLFSLTTLGRPSPAQEADFYKFWYRQIVHMYRHFRRSPAAFEILKTVVADKEPMAHGLSKVYDEEVTRVMADMAYIKGVDFQAVSALMIGAMSYLTLLSHSHRTLLGIDLSTEEGWKRIEEAVRVIYTALNRMAVQSPDVLMEVHRTGLPVEERKVA